MHSSDRCQCDHPSDDRISEKLRVTDHVPFVPVCCQQWSCSLFPFQLQGFFFDCMMSPSYYHCMTSPNYYHCMMSPSYYHCMMSPSYYHCMMSPSYYHCMMSPSYYHCMMSPNYYHCMMSPSYYHCMMSPSYYHCIGTTKFFVLFCLQAPKEESSPPPRTSPPTAQTSHQSASIPSRLRRPTTLEGLRPANAASEPTHPVTSASPPSKSQQYCPVEIYQHLLSCSFRLPECVLLL